MNRMPQQDWMTPMPPPRLAVVIPFPDRRRELGEQAVARALVERRREENRERATHRALLVLMALATVGTIALVSRVVS